MACACKVDAQMSYLQRKYGGNMPQNKKTDIAGQARRFFKRTLGWCIVIPFLPIAFISVLARRKKPINITKIFFKEDGRDK